MSKNLDLWADKVGLPTPKRPRACEAAIELLDTTPEERARWTAEHCDDCVVTLRTYSGYILRLSSEVEVEHRWLIFMGSRTNKEQYDSLLKAKLGAELKLAKLREASASINELARSLEGLAHSKRKGMR